MYLSYCRYFLLKPLSILGVEPEPFVIGDHLIDVSGKLSLLDKLLSFLYAGYVLYCSCILYSP